MIWFSTHASFRQEKPHKGKCGPQKVIYLSQELRKDITILVEQISLFCKLVARTDTVKPFIAIFLTEILRILRNATTMANNTNVHINLRDGY